MSQSYKRMRQCWRGGGYREPDYSFGGLSWSLGTDLHEKLLEAGRTARKEQLKQFQKFLGGWESEVLIHQSRKT